MYYREEVEFIFGTPNLVRAFKWKILSVTLFVTALLLSMHSQPTSVYQDYHYLAIVAIWNLFCIVYNSNSSVKSLSMS